MANRWIRRAALRQQGRQMRRRRAWQAGAPGQRWSDASSEEQAPAYWWRSYGQGPERIDYDVRPARAATAGGAAKIVVDYDAVEGAAKKEVKLSEEALRVVLFELFDEMEGHKKEFLPDGRPRVEDVNNRLKRRGMTYTASRAEIDGAFETWGKNKQGAES